MQRIGKLPVLVKDSPGFLVNRILLPYMIEAGVLFEQGASVEEIDEAMLDFGMPMGPLRLIDEVGVDVAEDVAADAQRGVPRPHERPARFCRKMIALGSARPQSRQGLLCSQKGREPKPSTTRRVRLRTGSSTAFAREELQQRMVLLMVNEAARCLEEGDRRTIPADVDFAMVMGTGFAPFRGGPLRYADSIGTLQIVGATFRAGRSRPATLRAVLRSARSWRATNGKPFYED